MDGGDGIIDVGTSSKQPTTTKGRTIELLLLLTVRAGLLA